MNRWAESNIVSSVSPKTNNFKNKKVLYKTNWTSVPGGYTPFCADDHGINSESPDYSEKGE
jgi:hypothetical protein